MASDEAEEAGRACVPHCRADSLNSAKGKAHNVIVLFFFFFFFTFHLENDFRLKKLQKQYKKSYIPFTSALLTMPKPLTVWITINCGKF